jgi:hypothetical protein
LQAYFIKMPSKVFNLRPDTLAIMAGSANVGPYARVLCIDATGGVVAAACVERMGGFGTLCCVHAEMKRYSFDVVRQLNSAAMCSRSVRHMTLEELILSGNQVAAEAVAAAAQPEATISVPGAHLCLFSSPKSLYVSEFGVQCCWDWLVIPTLRFFQDGIYMSATSRF